MSSDDNVDVMSEVYPVTESSIKTNEEFQPCRSSSKRGNVSMKDSNGGNKHDPRNCPAEEKAAYKNETYSHDHDGKDTAKRSKYGKCLGCYPFSRFPFFVLNQRNYDSALQKDAHTCDFHKDVNTPKLEIRCPTNRYSNIIGVRRMNESRLLSVQDVPAINSSNGSDNVVSISSQGEPDLDNGKELVPGRVKVWVFAMLCKLSHLFSIWKKAQLEITDNHCNKACTITS